MKSQEYCELKFVRLVYYLYTELYAIIAFLEGRLYEYQVKYKNGEAEKMGLKIASERANIYFDSIRISDEINFLESLKCTHPEVNKYIIDKHISKLTGLKEQFNCVLQNYGDLNETINKKIDSLD